MSAEQPAFTRTWRVGRHTATLTVPQSGPRAGAVMEWDGPVPTNLSRDEWRQYREGRDKAVADLAAHLKIGIAVVDV